MRILFTSPIMEHPASGGPQLRIENSIKALSKISELDIINRDPFVTNITNEFFKKYAIEYHLLTNSIRKGFFGRVIFWASKFINRFYDIKTAMGADFLIQHIDRRKIDILWFGYGNLSFPLIKRIKSLRPQLKIVCDTDSVWSRFVLRELPYAKGLRKFKIRMSGRKKEAEEKAWVDLCEVTTAVSEIDAQFYRDLAKDKSKIHIFSNVIDVQSYLFSTAPPVGFKTPSIYLAGSFGHFNSPMDSAARWILEEVFPLILKKHPNIHFYIVGRNSELGFGHMNGPNVTVTGRLDSVLPYLCNTNVALVPLKFESGTRFKILEAGVCNVPIVSTTLGAEGIPVVDEEHILIADEPKSFADAILRLLEDKSLANKLAKNCQDLVKEKYSVETLVHEAKSILEYLQHNKFEKSFKP
jgi:glycosyltransferase involved in cell wall biosynthesis